MSCGLLSLSMATNGSTLSGATRRENLMTSTSLKMSRSLQDQKALYLWLEMLRL